MILSYGLQVWDAYADEASAANYPDYDPRLEYGYALRHTFEIFPGATDTENAELVDGRDVPMSAAYIWPSEADPADDDLGTSERLESAPVRDPWGFPVPFTT